MLDEDALGTEQAVWVQTVVAIERSYFGRLAVVFPGVATRHNPLLC